MSSSESNSSSAPGPAPGEGKPRGSAALVVLALALLAGLVWAMAPPRAKFVPAPLRPMPPDCPKNTPDFVPSDATEIPGIDLRALSKEQRNRVLFRFRDAHHQAGDTEPREHVTRSRVQRPDAPHG